MSAGVMKVTSKTIVGDADSQYVFLYGVATSGEAVDAAILDFNSLYSPNRKGYYANNTVMAFGPLDELQRTSDLANSGKQLYLHWQAQDGHKLDSFLLNDVE